MMPDPTPRIPKPILSRTRRCPPIIPHQQMTSLQIGFGPLALNASFEMAYRVLRSRVRGPRLGECGDGGCARVVGDWVDGGEG